MREEITRCGICIAFCLSTMVVATFIYEADLRNLNRNQKELSRDVLSNTKAIINLHELGGPISVSKFDMEKTK